MIGMIRQTPHEAEYHATALMFNSALKAYCADTMGAWFFDAYNKFSQPQDFELHSDRVRMHCKLDFLWPVIDKYKDDRIAGLENAVERGIEERAYMMKRLNELDGRVDAVELDLAQRPEPQPVPSADGEAEPDPEDHEPQVDEPIECDDLAEETDEKTLNKRRRHREYRDRKKQRKAADANAD